MMMLIVVMLVSAMRKECVEGDGSLCVVAWRGDRVMPACVRGRFALCDGMVMWCGGGAAWAWVAVELEDLRALWHPLSQRPVLHRQPASFRVHCQSVHQTILACQPLVQVCLQRVQHC